MAGNIARAGRTSAPKSNSDATTSTAINDSESRMGRRTEAVLTIITAPDRNPRVPRSERYLPQR